MAEPKSLPRIHPIISRRKSPRAFSNKSIPSEELERLFEAARWAPSANNEQPWKYTYAPRGSSGFKDLWNCLLPGNQPWTKDTAVLVVASINTIYEKNGAVNQWAEHDLGLANAQLLLQAGDQGIYGHMMAGFDKGKVSELLKLPEEIKPICMIALGYLGEPDQLDEPYRSREIAPRQRKSLEKLVTKI